MVVAASQLAKKRRVMLADPHPVICTGWATLIKRRKDLIVCATATTRQDCLHCIQSANPDLIVLDPAFNDMDGIELIRQSTKMRPRASILVVSTINAHDYLPRIFRAGARGFLPKTAPPRRLLAAMRRILAGHRVLPFSGASATLQRSGMSGLGVLSDRELELFRFLGKGYTTPKIAEVMQLSEHTVHIYRLQIEKKLGLRDLSRLTQQAVLWEDQQH